MERLRWYKKPLEFDYCKEALIMEILENIIYIKKKFQKGNVHQECNTKGMNQEPFL